MRDVAVLINDDDDDKNAKDRKSNMSGASKCFTIDKIRFKGGGKAIILT